MKQETELKKAEMQYTSGRIKRSLEKRRLSLIAQNRTAAPRKVKSNGPIPSGASTSITFFLFFRMIIRDSIGGIEKKKETLPYILIAIGAIVIQGLNFCFGFSTGSAAKYDLLQMQLAYLIQNAPA